MKLSECVHACFCANILILTSRFTGLCERMQKNRKTVKEDIKYGGSEQNQIKVRFLDQERQRQQHIFFTDNKGEADFKRNTYLLFVLLNLCKNHGCIFHSFKGRGKGYCQTRIHFSAFIMYQSLNKMIIQTKFYKKVCSSQIIRVCLLFPYIHSFTFPSIFSFGFILKSGTYLRGSNFLRAEIECKKSL